MSIIERLTEAQRVLEEHTQYDDQEGSGEDLARLTCIDAKEAISELLAALKSLVGCVSEHTKHYDCTDDWEDAQDRVETARAAIAKATTNS
jgi:hypothetical protein